MNDLQSMSNGEISLSRIAIREMFDRVIAVAQILKTHTDLSTSNVDDLDWHNSGRKTQDHEAVVS